MQFDATMGKMLTFAEVANKLKLSPKHLDDMIKRHQFPANDRFLNGVKYWSERAVIRWMATQPSAKTN